MRPRFVGTPLMINEDFIRLIKKIIMMIPILLIFINSISYLGSTHPFAQELKFIIFLKSGAKIRTDKIMIEDDVVYYLFSSYNRKKVGIAKSSIEEIREVSSGKEIIVYPVETDFKTKIKDQVSE